MRRVCPNLHAAEHKLKRYICGGGIAAVLMAGTLIPLQRPAESPDMSSHLDRTYRPWVDGSGLKAGIHKAAWTAPMDVYSGNVPTVPAVSFGGSGFCNYQNSFENVQLNVLVQPRQGIAAGMLVAVFHEITTSPCQFAPTPLTQYMYRSASGFVSGNNIHITFTSLTPNAIGFSLVFDGVVSPTRTISGKLTWSRNGMPPALTYSLSSNVYLTNVAKFAPLQSVSQWITNRDIPSSQRFLNRSAFSEETVRLAGIQISQSPPKHQNIDPIGDRL